MGKKITQRNSSNSDTNLKQVDYVVCILSIRKAATKISLNNSETEQYLKKIICQCH